MKQIYTDHLGQTFSSLSEMAQHWNKSKSTVERRLNTMHLTIEQALTLDNCKSLQRQCQDHLGNIFASKAKMCEHYHIPSSVYFGRIGIGWSVEQALTTPLNLTAKNSKSITDHLGQTFPSINAMCKHWNVPRSSFVAHKKAGWTTEQALTTKVEKIQTQRKTCTDHLGNTFPSKNAMCRAYQTSRHILNSRLALGWTLKDALTKPNMITSTIIKDYQNNTFPSLRDMAHYYHVPEYKLQGKSLTKDETTKVLQSGFPNGTKIGNILVHKCIQFPYYDISENGQHYAIHFDRLLTEYHAIFHPIPNRKITMKNLEIQTCVGFPNYRVLHENETKIWSYWDIIWYIHDNNFGLSS